MSTIYWSGVQRDERPAIKDCFHLSKYGVHFLSHDLLGAEGLVEQSLHLFDPSFPDTSEMWRTCWRVLTGDALIC